MPYPRFYLPWSKQRIWRCKDGSEKMVYKNADHALPLFIAGWAGRLEGSAAIEMQAETQLSAEYQTRIHGLLYQLDHANRDLAVKFRLVYVVYQSDPCREADYLRSEVHKLLEEHQKLRIHLNRLDGLISLAKLGNGQLPWDNRNFWDAYREVQRELDPSDVREDVARMMADSIKDAKAWMEAGS